MKKTILILSISAISLCLSAQDKNQAVNTKKLSYVSGDISIQKFYTEDELNKMNKLELTVLYKERINYLVEVIPYLALHSQPGATLYDMAIPETPQNLAHLDKETKNKKAFLSSVGVTLNDIVPYADKSNIVWCILFYENIIKKSSESFGTQLPKTTDNSLQQIQPKKEIDEVVIKDKK